MVDEFVVLKLVNVDRALISHFRCANSWKRHRRFLWFEVQFFNVFQLTLRSEWRANNRNIWQLRCNTENKSYLFRWRCSIFNRLLLRFRRIGGVSKYVPTGEVVLWAVLISKQESFSTTQPEPPVANLFSRDISWSTWPKESSMVISTHTLTKLELK